MKTNKGLDLMKDFIRFDFIFKDFIGFNFILIRIRF